MEKRHLGVESSFLGGPSCLDPICLLGSVPSAVAAPGNKKGGVCPHGAYGLMVGMDAARASSTVM